MKYQFQKYNVNIILRKAEQNRQIIIISIILLIITSRQMDFKFPTTRCPQCSKDIIQANFPLHQVRCNGLAASRVSLGPSVDPPRELVVPQPLKRIENPMGFIPHSEPEAMRVASQQRYHNQQAKQPRPEAASARRYPIFTSELGRVPEALRKKEEERFPCHNCGYNMTLAEFDTHPNSCDGRQKRCEYCAVEYPSVLLADHQKLCPTKKEIENMRRQAQREEEEQQEEFHSFESDQQEESYEYGYIPHRLPARSARSGQVREVSLNQMIATLFSGRNVARIFSRMIQAHEMPAEQGLNRNQLRRLKRYKYKKTSQNVLCTICYCNLETNEEVIELKCKHMYHDECLSKWLEQNPKCPVCKQQAQ